MRSGRALGIDYGDRRVGVALSDPLWLTASPYAVFDRADAVDAIAAVVATHDVGVIAIGLPVHLAGNEGASAARARAFGEEVSRKTDKPVEFVDERLTTKVAQDALIEGGVRRRERKRLQDKVAAALILQSFLDAHQEKPT